MLKKTRRRQNNEINAGSMADIAFLLLIFFLVTTTILEDQGILVKLPVWVDEPITQDLNTNNVLSVKINGNDDLLVEGEEVLVPHLKRMTKEFIANPYNRPDRPSEPKNAVVSLQNDRSTSYEAYIAVYNELKAAYSELRNEEALKRYGKQFADLLPENQKMIRDKIPLVISEAEPSDYFAEAN